MKIEITKAACEERTCVHRDDGSTADFSIPTKGPIAHDAVHFFVEKGFGIERGFWGMVAAGGDPGAIQRAAKAGGHASAKRAAPPDKAIEDLIRAERLVECFEAEGWSGAIDNEGIRAMAKSGWEASFVSPIALESETIGQVRGAINRFAQEWAKLDKGGVMTLNW